MRTVRIAVLISIAATALLVLPDAASARWKTLNGPLIQNTGTGFCICKDGIRVEIGRFRNDGIPWDAWQFSATGRVPGIAANCDEDQVDNPGAFDRVCLQAGSGQKSPIVRSGHAVRMP